MKRILGLGLAAGVSTGAYLALRKKKLDYDEVWGTQLMTVDEFVRANLMYVIGAVDSAPYSRQPFLNNFDQKFTQGEIRHLERLCETFRMIPVYYYRYEAVTRHTSLDSVNVTPHCIGAFFFTSKMYDKAPRETTDPRPLLINYNAGRRSVERVVSVPMIEKIREVILSRTDRQPTEKLYFVHIIFPAMPWEWDTLEDNRPKIPNRDQRPPTLTDERRGEPSQRNEAHKTSDLEWLEKYLDKAFLNNGPTYEKSVQARNSELIRVLKPTFNDLKREHVKLYMDELEDQSDVLVHEWQHKTVSGKPLPHLTFSTHNKDTATRVKQVYERLGLAANIGLCLRGITDTTPDSEDGRQKYKVALRGVACNAGICVDPSSIVRLFHDEMRQQLRYEKKPLDEHGIPKALFLYVGVIWFTEKPTTASTRESRNRPDANTLGIRWAPGETLLYELLELLNPENNDVKMTDWRDEVVQGHWDRREPFE